MQSLSCVLEIGFLYRRIESGYLTKYKLSGEHIKRKLERFLFYGKKLEHLNYPRLLKSMVPDEIANIVVVNSSKTTLFSLNSLNLQSCAEFVEKDNTIFKTGRYYTIAFPLFQKGKVKGNLLIFISDKGIQNRILPIVKEVILKFFLVLIVLIFILHLLLHLYIDKPFRKYINILTKAVINKNQTILNPAGIDMENYFGVENIIDTLKNDQWLEERDCRDVNSESIDHQEEMHTLLNDYYQLFEQIKSIQGLKKAGMVQNVINESLCEIPWQDIDDNMKKYEKIKKNHDFILSVRRLWKEINKNSISGERVAVKEA